MEEKNNKNNSKINRRDFFKLAGAGTFASAAALYGCSGKNNRSDSESAALGEIPIDKMVYRTNPTTGDRVSLLGYGCMRWPTRKRADGVQQIIIDVVHLQVLERFPIHGN